MKIQKLLTLGLSVPLALLAQTPPTPAQQTTQPAFRHFLHGNFADVKRAARPGFVLMGGGTDVDAAFRWLIERSGGGDIVVIRASGTEAYNPYIAGLGAVDSVETIVFSRREASDDPFVLERIRNAEAIWIAGGDQGNYIKYWKGTPVETAINELAARGVPIGGTSAGLAVLGEFSFAALQDTIRSPEALANPYDPRITLEDNFLKFPLLKGIITDSHFNERDRLGRTLVFLARLVQDGKVKVAHGIAVDRRTAVLLDEGGTATVVGEGPAYFYETTEPPTECRAGAPLTLRSIRVVRMKSGEGTFDVRAWKANGGTAYSLSVVNGKAESTQPGGSPY